MDREHRELTEHTVTTVYTRVIWSWVNTSFTKHAELDENVPHCTCVSLTRRGEHSRLTQNTLKTLDENTSLKTVIRDRGICYHNEQGELDIKVHIMWSVDYGCNCQNMSVCLSL